MKFTILYRRADHSDAHSLTAEYDDIDQAARRAVEDCNPEEFVVAVFQTDTPSDDLLYLLAR